MLANTFSDQGKLLLSILFPFRPITFKYRTLQQVKKSQSNQDLYLCGESVTFQNALTGKVLDMFTHSIVTILHVASLILMEIPQVQHVNLKQSNLCAINCTLGIYYSN